MVFPGKRGDTEGTGLGYERSRVISVPSVEHHSVSDPVEIPGKSERTPVTREFRKRIVPGEPVYGTKCE